MRKKYINRTIALVLSFVVIATAIFLSQEYLFINDDANSWRVRNFYLEDKNSLDMVILGSSEVFAGFSPGLAYANYGYTSYPLATDSSSVEVWKSQLNEVINYQNPDLILLEISGALYEKDEQIYDDISLRRYLDNIPLSTNKLSTLTECKLQEDSLSYLFSIIKYHDNMNNAFHAFQEKVYYSRLGYSRLRGFLTRAYIDETPSLDVSSKKTLELNDNALHYLTDFIDYCKNKKIENIVFCRFPHKYYQQTDLDLVYRKNTAKQIITDAGFSFWDFETNSDEIGLTNADYYNCYHLNVYGAEKLTNHISEIAIKECGLKPNYLSEKNKIEWQDTANITKKLFEYVKIESKKGTDEIFYETKSSLVSLN